MKRLILTVLSILTLNMGFSQDVSPCYGLEMVSPINGEMFFALEIDLTTIGCETCDIEMSWQPGNVYGPSYLVFPSNTDLSFDICCSVDISGEINETCLVCNQFMWLDTAWGPFISNNLPEYVLEEKNEGFYYDLNGKEFNSYNEIPLWSVYIHNNKKYIKE